MDHHAQGRTSIEIEPTPMTGSSSSSAIRRPTSQQRLQAPDGDIHDTDDDSHGHGGNGGGRGKNTHWGRNWIRYVALTCIIGALVLMITLLVLRPWEQKHGRFEEKRVDGVTHTSFLSNAQTIDVCSTLFVDQEFLSFLLHPFPPPPPLIGLLPITNDAVKVLPENQPIWPVPRSFSHGEGTEKIILAPNFQIKVQSSASSPPVALAPDSILAKAIARCMDRLQVKRNTTIWTATDVPVADITETTPTLAELTLIVDDTQAKLEYGMVESYAVNIGNQHAGSTDGTPQSLVDLEKRALHHVYSLRARAEPDSPPATTAVVTATTQWGAIHALDTFTQIVVATKAAGLTNAAQPNNQLEIPNTPWSIYDEPRFSHRGILVDTSRNYIGVPDIIRTLDAMAVVKLNVFHWHVLDQQTYPLVSKAFPDLTAKGAQTPEKIYTPQDVAAIIQHGAERGIRVLPEFDSPGHAASWGRAYPNLTVCLDALPHSTYAAEPPAGQLDPLEPFTYTVLDTLVKEWSGQFPDSQAHVGGDEVNMNCWKSSKRLSDYIANENHRAAYEKAIMPFVDTQPDDTKATRTMKGRQSGEDKLLELYLDRIFAMFIAQGKRPIVWEEMALEHNVRLPSSAIIQVWKNAINAKKGKTTQHRIYDQQPWRILQMLIFLFLCLL
jgi:hexosaminidase